MSVKKPASMLSGMDQSKWNIAGKSMIGGLFAGLLAILYRIALESGLELSKDAYAYLKLHPSMILPWLVGIVAAGCFLTWLVKLEPMASGSGIPQVEGLLIYGLKMRGIVIIPIRFVAGFLSSIFGVSLGREGPSIQIGASASQVVAKKLASNKLEENYMITGGAAAGLSAAFSAPLSGIMFALEEVHRSFSAKILIAATTAALTANVLSNYVFGLKPELSFIQIPQLPVGLYWWLIPVGIFSGVVGACMNKSLLLFQILYKKIPVWSRAVIALLVALPVGLFAPDLLGGGVGLIAMAEKQQLAIGILVVFLLVKILFTCTSFGSGIPGGIFMPILATGAMAGCFIGLIAIHFGMPQEYLPQFCVCAMAGTLSGSVKAPVTSIMLTAEMTGSLVHLLPVSVCAFSAMLVSDLLKTTPIYEALLERIMESSGDSVAARKTGALIEVPVDIGSKVHGKKIKEVSWPEGALIISIHRGQKELVPKGDTKIHSGDYLIVLSSEQRFDEISMELQGMCRTL